METCAVCKGAHCGKLFAPATATEGPPRKPPSGGRDGTGRLCPGMGRVGQGSADINNGYLVPGICSRVSEEWGLDGHAGNVGLGTLLVEYALLTFPRVPCVPRGARLVCSWRLLCWRQLRLPLSGYRGAFLRPPSF